MQTPPKLEDGPTKRVEEDTMKAENQQCVESGLPNMGVILATTGAAMQEAFLSPYVGCSDTLMSSLPTVWVRLSLL